MGRILTSIAQLNRNFYYLEQNELGLIKLVNEIFLIIQFIY